MCARTSGPRSVMPAVPQRLLRRRTLTQIPVPAGLSGAAVGCLRGGQMCCWAGFPRLRLVPKPAAKRDGKNPTLTVGRKTLRCYHTLPELGDAALALPDIDGRKRLREVASPHDVEQ